MSVEILNNSFNESNVQMLFFKDIWEKVSEITQQTSDFILNFGSSCETEICDKNGCRVESCSPQHSQYFSSKATGLSFKSEAEKKDFIKKITLDQCEQQLQSATKIFLECDAAKKLWDQVKKKDAFSVKCVPFAEAPTGGKVTFKTRQISISEADENIGDTLLFELINLDRAKESITNVQQICSIPADEYAQQVESFEYENAKSAHKIAAECINVNKKWPKNWAIFKDQFSGPTLWSTFDKCLETQKKTGHYQARIAAWNQLCQGSCTNPNKT